MTQAGSPKDLSMQLKFCIWDVGKVIYDFSFAPLDKWCRAHTSDLQTYCSRIGKLDYNDYMRGEISFEQWCRRLCDFYKIAYFDEVSQEINQAMLEGISEDFPVTRQLMLKMKEHGIENCVLSNALPNLAQAGSFQKQNLVKPEYLFTSFELGLLKPDAAIYEAVRQRLNAKFSEMLFIDDKPENVEGALSCGLEAIVFDKKTIENEIFKRCKF